MGCIAAMSNKNFPWLFFHPYVYWSGSTALRKAYQLVFIVNVFQREVLHIKEFLDLNEEKKSIRALVRSNS